MTKSREASREAPREIDADIFQIEDAGIPLRLP
jgi:hypothetical protein